MRGACITDALEASRNGSGPPNGLIKGEGRQMMVGGGKLFRKDTKRNREKSTEQTLPALNH